MTTYDKTSIVGFLPSVVIQIKEGVNGQSWTLCPMLSHESCLNWSKKMRGLHAFIVFPHGSCQPAIPTAIPVWGKVQKGGRKKGKSAKVDLARLRMTKGESAQTSLSYDFLIDPWKSKTKQTARPGLEHFSWELVKLPNPYSVILCLFWSSVSRIKEAPKNKTESGMSLWWGWHRPICPTSVERKLLWKWNKWRKRKILFFRS